eukprot:gene13281-9122_t
MVVDLKSLITKKVSVREIQELMTDAESNRGSTGRKRSHSNYCFEYVETAKKSKDGLSPAGVWKMLQEMKSRIMACLSEVDPRDLEGSHPIKFTNSDILRDLDRCMLFFFKICERMRTSSTNKGHFLFVCVTAVSLFPTMLPFRQAIHGVIFQMFDQLFQRERDDFELLLEALLGDMKPNLRMFIPSPYIKLTEDVVTISLAPAFLEEILESDMETKLSLFQCELRAQSDLSRACILYNITSLIQQLLEKYPLWCPSIIILDSLVDIACSVLALSDTRKVDSARVDALGHEAAGQLLLSLTNRNVLPLRRYGCQILYYTARRLELVMHAVDSDSWEVRLMQWMDACLDCTEAEKADWVFGLLASPDVAPYIFHFSLRLFDEAIKNNSDRRCALLLHLGSLLTRLLQHISHSMGLNEASHHFLMTIQPEFAHYIRHVIRSAGQGLFPIAGLKRDAFALTMKGLRGIFGIFPAELVRKILDEIRKEIHPDGASTLGVVEKAALLICYTAQGTSVRQDEILGVLQSLSALVEGGTMRSPSLAVVIRCITGLLGIIMVLPDTNPLEDLLSLSEICVKNLKYVAQTESESTLCGFLDALVQFMMVSTRNSRHGVQLKSFVVRFLRSSREIPELSLMIATGALMGLQKHLRLLFSKPDTQDALVHLDSSPWVRETAKVDCVLHCLSIYLYLLPEWESTICAFLHFLSSEDATPQRLSALQQMMELLSEVQVQIYICACFLDKLQFMNTVSLKCSAWKSSVSSLVVVDVDEEGDRIINESTVLPIIEERHHHLFSFLMETLFDFCSGVQDKRFVSTMRRACCACFCLCPNDDASETQLEKLFVQHVLEDDDIVTRCGYGGLAACVAQQLEPSFSLVEKCRTVAGETWPFSPTATTNGDHSLTRLSRRLFFFRCLFDQDWREQVFLSSGLRLQFPSPEGGVLLCKPSIDARLILRGCLTFLARQRRERTSENLLSHHDALRYVVRVVSNDCFVNLRWCEIEAFRYEPGLSKDMTLLYSSSTKADPDVGGGFDFVSFVILSAMDRIAGTPLWVEVEESLLPFQKDEKGNSVDPLQGGAVIAKLLWSPEKQAKLERDALLRMIDSIGSGSKDQKLRRALFFLLSMEGEYQMEMEEAKGMEASCNIGRSDAFCAALGQLATLIQVPVVNSAAFASLTEGDHATEKLSPDLFLLLDMIYKLTNPEPKLMPLSLFGKTLGTSRRRWLLALRSLLEFLGLKTTLIAANVSSMLKMYSADAHLVPLTASVWCKLIENCTKEYLEEQLHALLTELLMMEQKCWSNPFGLQMLQKAIWHLYHHSREKPAWSTYLLVLPFGSQIIQRVRDIEAANPTVRISVSEALHSFALLLQSSSIDSKGILVRSFYCYLHSLLPSERISSQSNSSLAVQALLFSSRDLSDGDVELVLRSVGLIGAISTDFSSVSFSREAKARVTNTDFDPALYTSWRKLLLELLNKYLPQALATTKMKIHRDAAFASQELIRVGVMRESNGESHGPVPSEKLRQFTWWRELQPGSRQLIEVFTSTDYHLYRRQEPHYSDDTHKSWLFHLYSDLVALTTDRLKKMVHPLCHLAKYFYPVLAWLFPYIAMDALRNTKDAGTLMIRQFRKLYEKRNNDDINSRESWDKMDAKERLITCLKAFECFRQTRWTLLHVALRKPTNIDLSTDACISMAAALHSFLNEDEWDDPNTPSWAQRAKAAFSIGNGLMALRFIEAQLRIPSHETVQTLLGKESVRIIFEELGDYDSAKSIYKGPFITDPVESAMISENNGEWSSAIQNCEIALQSDRGTVSHQVTILRCLRELGHLQLASRYAKNLLHSSRVPMTEAARRKIQLDACEAAWRLGDWDTILEDKEVSKVPSLAFPVAQWIRVVRGQAPVGALYQATQKQRMLLAPLIRSSYPGDYAQLYPHIATLHGLSDLESSASHLVADEGENSYVGSGSWGSNVLSRIATDLQQRLESVESTLEVKEPLLSLHRCIYEELSMTSSVPSVYDAHIRLLRDRGYLEAALGVAKQAFARDTAAAPLFYVPMAELLYETGSKMQAVAFASQSMQNTKKRDVRSRLLLLVTDWQMEGSDQTQEEIIRGYEGAIALCASEIAHHKLALFYEKLFLAPDQKSLVGYHSDERYLTALKAVEHFGKALLIGCDTLLVSLPRMLTLWLDTVHELSAQDSRSLGKTTGLKSARESSASSPHPAAKSSEQMIAEFNMTIIKLIRGENSIPLAYLVTALRQLLSRLEHPHHEVVSIISDVVVNLLQTFPQPCLWHVLPIAFGKPDSTANIVKERILKPFAQAQQNAVVRRDAEKMFEALIGLCNYAPANFKAGARLTQMPFMKEIPSLLRRFNFILPTLCNMTPNPWKGKRTNEVFPVATTFAGFDDTVVLMKSKQQPKRIQVRSSDGSTVPFLCKADDEPRKDIRMMDLAALINKFLLQDSDARRRRLSLRRYTVAALSNKCALIEWVRDLNPLYGLVMGCYQLCHMGIEERKIKTLYDEARSKHVRKVDVLRNSILPAFPPIFHCWFDKQFTTNDDWYGARLLYTESAALWSVAGHIVGLGDRHGENILVSQRSGEVMHVDFAEMFDSAELLPVPELVRFRLTPNIVDGMGVLGTQGTFQAVCCTALRCQMKNSNALMSIAETHLHEPNGKCSKFPIQRMSRRLKGYLDFYNPQTRSAFPLSTVALNVEGQVSKLISHSASLENLSEMYTWWRPWI